MAAKVNAGECIGCGACVEACPSEAISLNEVAVVDEGACIDCGVCVDECPTEAITL